MASAKQLCWRASLAIIFIASGVVATLATRATLKSLEESTQAKALAESERRIADIKAQGSPVDFESLEALYESRTNPDDTVAWVEVLQRLASKEFAHQTDTVYPIGHDSPPTTPERALALLDLQRTVVQQDSDLLVKVHELASHKKPVRFNIEYSKWLTQKDDFIDYLTSRRRNTPWLASIDEYVNTLRKLMNLLTCETLVAVAGKDSVLILDTLKTQINLVSTFGGETLFGDCNNMTYMQLTIARNVKLAIESNTLNQQQIEELSKDLQAMPSVVQNWQRVVQSERAWLLAHLRGQQPLYYYSRKPGTQMRLKASGPDLLTFLEYMERFEKIDWSSSKVAMESFIKIEDDLQREPSPPPYRTYRYWWIWKRSISWWHEIGGHMTRTASERNQAIVGCALKLYQMKNGDFPERLDQLVDVGLDPKNYLCAADRPFGYERRNDTAYLWGPTQLGTGFPFSLNDTNPKDSKPPDDDAGRDYVLTQRAENLWTLSSDVLTSSP